MSKQFPSPHEDFLGANLTTSRLTLTVKRFRTLARIFGGLTKITIGGNGVTVTKFPSPLEV